MMKRKRFWLVFFSFCIVLLIKCYFAAVSFNNTDFSKSTAFSNGDSGHYLTIAENIHTYHAYSDDSTTIPSESATWRPPIWPFVLSFLFIFTSSVFWLLVLKLFLETFLIAISLYFYKKEQKLTWLCFIPFLLLFIEPQYLKYSSTFLSENFTAILILLLSILFLNLEYKKTNSFIVPILAATIVLCHPVSIFFITIFMGFYCLINLKTNLKTTLAHGTIYFLLLSIWPIRNAILFDKGIYLTASQGATFSKGWNAKVATDFSNVDGDLADESLNLKYVKESTEKLPTRSVVALSKLYQQGTYNYINSLTFSQKVKIILKKIKSNFNPFPEKPKNGFLEYLAIMFRIVYIVLFAQLFLRILKIRKFDFESQTDKAFLVVLCIFIGQTLMAAYIYTGLRFNAVYSLCLLFCFIVVNHNLIRRIITKLS